MLLRDLASVIPRMGILKHSMLQFLKQALLPVRRQPHVPLKTFPCGLPVVLSRDISMWNPRLDDGVCHLLKM